MHRERIAILGTPIDNLTMDQTVEQIFALIDAYRADKRCRQVATVNVDFIVNTLAWSLKRIRHPELLDILRRADLVTPDGMPIVWAGKLLGARLKERVSGADLVPRLAQRAAELQKSIYFLGGREDVGQKAADILVRRYPGLKIAGVDSPFVHIEGAALAQSEEQDRPVVDRINRSGADILLIGFGNPKQEIWFDRNRTRLKVPVSIGIGGTYEFILGTVARAPLWMQKTGLEWVFRITQDPGRLWRRYFVGFFKFGLMILPAVLYYRFKRLLFDLSRKKSPPPGAPLPSLTKGLPMPLALLPVPNPLDASTVATAREEFETTLAQHPNAVLDFGDVDFIDSSGLGLLVSLWRTADRKNKSVFMTGVKASTRRFFEFSRILDLFSEHIFEDLGEVARYVNERAGLPRFYTLEVIRPGSLLYHLYGELDAAQVSALDVEAFIERVADRDCIFDLKDLAFVDSSGIMFFLKLQKRLAANNRVCVFCAPGANVGQMFRITKLDRFFTTAPTLADAEKLLSAPVPEERKV